MTIVSSQTSPESRDGQVVTFYSFKGGVGRTMALANVAWILAENGQRVLVADWDLESPGLYRYLHPFIDEREVLEGRGIIDLIREYQRAAMDTDPEDRHTIFTDLARVERYAFSLQWEFQHGGSLDFLSPGKLNRDYVAALSGMDWDNFYGPLSGGQFLSALKADMKRSYDYALIDSRTGFSDISAICTVHLPDIMVDCFTLNNQSVQGAAEVASDIQRRYSERNIRLLPVPMRVDLAEKKKVDDGRLAAIRHFPGLPAGMSADQRSEYWSSVEIPHQAFYAYEETLAVFGDKPDMPGSLLAAFERLTARITENAITALPRMEEQLRLRTMAKFERGSPITGDLFVIESLGADQAWAEWIAAVLSDVGIAVRHRLLDLPDVGPETALDVESESAQVLVVVSPTYLEWRSQLQRPAERPNLAVYVTPSTPLAEVPPTAAVFLWGLPEDEAVERLRKLLGLSIHFPSDGATTKLRYPGREPRLFEAPARPQQFTGREGDLWRLRSELRDYTEGTVRPVVLYGLDGVGKTQIALEYMHRFRTDYDLIWWLDCEQPTFIDASLADLGEQLRTTFGLRVRPSANVAAMARQVTEALGRSGLRWLAIFNHANEVEPVLPLVPPAGGQVIITSSNRGWTDHGAKLLVVDVFTREESVADLRKRVPMIGQREAEQIADAVGDLPLAVAQAGAWLADTGFSVSALLEELAPQPHRMLTEFGGRVASTWNVSLDQLAKRSPAAARLFELCSVTAQRISLDLIYDPEMVELLRPRDAKLTDQIMIGRAVQEVNRLALIKLDTSLRQITVNPLVQQAVRDRMTAEQLESTSDDVHRLLAAARPSQDVDDPETWPQYRLIWPHLEPTQAARSQREAVRQLIIDRVRYLYLRAGLDRAHSLAAEVQDRWEAMEQDAGDPATAGSLHRQLLHLRYHLGVILRAQGMYQEAAELNTRVWEEQQDLLGPDHPHTLMTAGSVAADLRVSGRYPEALEMDRRTYPAWVDLSGEDYPRALAAAHNLGISLRLNGAVAEAMRRNTATFERRRVTLGPSHPRTLSSARGIVWDLLEAGEYAEAVTQIQDVYRITADAFRADSSEAREAQVLLGIALRAAGRPAEAEESFRDALAGLTARFGESSSEALACRLSYALNAMSLEKFDEGEAEVRSVLAAYQEQLGPQHPHTLGCWVDLAAALRFTRQHEEATRAIRQAVEGFSTVLDPEHPYTLAAKTSAGVLLADQGDLIDAERMEASTVGALAGVLGPDHPDTLRCRANLLLTRHDRGDEESLVQRSATIDQLAARLGDAHPNIVTLRAQRRLMRSLDPQPF
jgi:tetratricopeptide (TPR) repeat protein